MRISDWSSDVCSSDLERSHRHRDIDRHVEQHGGHTLGRGGGKADQRETDVVDRRIGEQPLDAGLADRAHRTKHDGCKRGEDHDLPPVGDRTAERRYRSEEHTSELQSLMRNSYAAFCLNKKTKVKHNKQNTK